MKDAAFVLNRRSSFRDHFRCGSVVIFNRLGHLHRCTFNYRTRPDKEAELSEELPLPLVAAAGLPELLGALDVCLGSGIKPGSL